MRPPSLSWLIICSSDARAEAAPRVSRRLLLAVIGDLAGPRLVRHHVELVARFRRRIEAQHFDRHRGPGFLDLLALVVDQRAHPAPGRAGDENVAELQRAALHQNRGHRAAALVELRFDHDARRPRGPDWP